MEVRLKTNRTKAEPEYRLVLKAKEIVDYVYPRFKFIKGNFKINKWIGKNGLQLHYKRLGDNVVVGFEEPGYGVTDTYYTLDQLREEITGNK